MRFVSIVLLAAPLIRAAGPAHHSVRFRSPAAEVFARHEPRRSALGRGQLQGPRPGAEPPRQQHRRVRCTATRATQLLEFDENGKYLREVGRGVYGLGYAHSVRFDKYDNLWVVDKGTNTVMRFNPAGYVTLNLGRRPEGPDEPE